MSTDDYSESAGQHSTPKTAGGGVQPSRIKTDEAGDSEAIASGIAERKTGDPGAFERAPAHDDRSVDDGAKTRGDDDDKEEEEPGLLSKLKVPLIVSAVVVTVAGALLAVAKQSKEAEERDA